MTVKELIECLEHCDPNMNVGFAYNYGDYWRTTVVDKISKLDSDMVTYSEYHQMMRLVTEPEQRDEQPELDSDEDTGIEWVILR